MIESNEENASALDCLCPDPPPAPEPPPPPVELNEWFEQLLASGGVTSPMQPFYQARAKVVLLEAQLTKARKDLVRLRVGFVACLVLLVMVGIWG